MWSCQYCQKYNFAFNHNCTDCGGIHTTNKNKTTECNTKKRKPFSSSANMSEFELFPVPNLITTWVCGDCTYINVKEHLACSGCGKTKPEEIVETTWTCLNCTYNNVQKRRRCQICNEMRGFIPIPAEMVMNGFLPILGTTQEPAADDKEFQETYDKPFSSFYCDCGCFNASKDLKLLKKTQGRERLHCGMCMKERQGYWICPICMDEVEVTPVENTQKKTNGKHHECKCGYKTKVVHITFRDGFNFNPAKDEEWKQIFERIRKQTLYDLRNQEKDSRLQQEIDDFKKARKLFIENPDKETIIYIQNVFATLVKKKDVQILQKLINKFSNERNFLKGQIGRILVDKSIYQKMDTFFLEEIGLWLILNGLPVPEFWKPLTTPMFECPQLIQFLLFTMKTIQLADSHIIVCGYLTFLSTDQVAALRKWYAKLNIFLHHNQVDRIIKKK